MLVGNTEPSPSDDVYALGLIGWWLFTGQHAYGGVPADEAMAQSLLPKGTSRDWRERERRALLRALRLTREARPRDAGQFLALFQGIAQRNRVLAALALLLVLASGGWTYQLLAPTGPEVPFSELPLDTQQAFQEQLQQGYAHLEISDIDGALRYFDAAWLLHPWNADAVDALDHLVDRVAVLYSDARSPEMAALLAPSLEAMRSNPYLADQSELSRLSKAVSAVYADP